MPGEKTPPSFGKALWQGWKRIASRLADIQARVLLTILYAVLVLPLGVVVQLLKDSLRIKRPPGHWLAGSAQERDEHWARRQW